MTASPWRSDPLHRQRRDRGARHGERTEMAALDLRCEWFGRAHHFRRAPGRPASAVQVESCSPAWALCAIVNDRPDGTRPRRA